MGVKRAAGFLIFRRLNDAIEYLLLRASYGTKHWSPPKGLKWKFQAKIVINDLSVLSIWKGHVDPGEDDFTTALRETREEAGYQQDDLIIYESQKKELNYKVKKNDKTVIYWLAELRSPTKDPILSDEHIDFKWLKKDEAVNLSGFPDFATMVEHFHKEITENKLWVKRRNMFFEFLFTK